LTPDVELAAPPDDIMIGDAGMMPGHILLVEDEQALARAYTRTLKLHGLEATWVSDATSALGELRQRNYDVIVSDIMLPDHSGLDLLRHVRNSDPDLPMVLVTGMPNLLPDEKLVGGGLHSTGARGHLDVHLDFNMLRDRGWHRRLNILVYMNKGWQPEWNGEFELWNEDVSQLREKFLPIFNRCVMFNTNNVSYHGVNAVKCPEGQSRKSFAAYYYTKEAPADFNGPPSNGQFHDTIFKARPDEKLKSVMMPVEAATKNLTKFLRRGASKLKKAVTGGDGK
jgi:CheY-like chemotaxis protein